MKLLLVPILLTFNSVLAQTEEFIFTSPDKVTNCKSMQSGRFESTTYSPSDYYMIIKDGFQTEFVAGGQYYVKSKIEFKDKCSYKSTVVEVTIPDYNVKPGEFATTDIVETQCEFIKIKTKIGDKELLTVLKKIN